MPGADIGPVGVDRIIARVAVKCSVAASSSLLQNRSDSITSITTPEHIVCMDPVFSFRTTWVERSWAYFVRQIGNEPVNYMPSRFGLSKSYPTCCAASAGITTFLCKFPNQHWRLRADYPSLKETRGSSEVILSIECGYLPFRTYATNTTIWTSPRFTPQLPTPWPRPQGSEART